MTYEIHSIGAVERDTGIPKDTLRIWERRYGFPVPERNAQGERCYPAEQVGVLRLLKQLVDRGHRPGKVVGRDPEELRELLAADAGSEGHEVTDPDVAAPMAALEQQDAVRLQALLQSQLLRHGVEAFVTAHLAPLITRVGESWSAGRLAIHQEHLFSDQVERLLTQAISGLPLQSQRRTALLATLPGERHRLGLRMAEALFATRGHRCVVLGCDLPVDEIAVAATAHGTDLVTLSISANAAGPATGRAVVDLGERLPEGCELWVGGQGAPRRRKLPGNVRLIADLDDLMAALDADGGERS